MGRTPRRRSPPPAGKTPVTRAGAERKAAYLGTGKSRWLARIVLAVGSPLLALVVLEGVLRLIGFGYPTHFFLPSTIGGHRMFVQNDRFTWRFLGRDMARQSFPTAISNPKERDTIRLFVLGESAAYGDPEPDFGLPRMLEALLNGRYPKVSFEVINAAMTAINSHVILPVARDCASADGDVWIIYMGNNEVVGPFGAGTVFGGQGASLMMVRASLALRTMRAGQLLGSLTERLANRPSSTREWGGMGMFLQNQVTEDDPRMPGVYSHFERNLQDIFDVARKHSVKVVVGTVVSNLRDCAPFASLHRRGLPASDLAEWTRLYQSGREAQRAGQLAQASGLFQQASRLDDSFAELQFAWGQCCLALGQDQDARLHFIRARDADALRFRADTRINEILRASAAGRQAQGIDLVDTARLLGEQSPHGLPGSELLYEHVHLKFEGNYLLARAFADEVVKMEPRLSAQPTNMVRGWPNVEDCAKRLGWTQPRHYEIDRDVLGRLTDAPFTGQLNHDEQCGKLRAELERLRPAVTSEGLRQAEQECRSVQHEFRQDWVLNKELALIRERLRDYAGAAECWRAVVKSLPHYTEGWQALGRALIEEKEDPQAHAALEQALRLDPDSPVTLTGLAEILGRQGDENAAIACYQRILRLKPYWGPAHLGIARALEKTGRQDEARQHLRQALQNRIYTPAALKGLAAVCFEQGWYGDAATNFVAALKLDPLDPSTELNLGLTLGLLGRDREAQEHYLQALRLDPTVAEAYVRLGLELGRQGNDAGAMTNFARAVELKPDLVEARLDLGIALLNQHRSAEALEQFQTVLRQSPTNAIARRYVQALGQKL